MKSLNQAINKMNEAEETNENEREEDDETDFVANYINSNIKNIEDAEMSLDKMGKEIYELDRVMDEKIENHVLKTNEYEIKFENIKKKMKIITSSVENVDKQAEEGAEILTNLCSDIKRLDIGKQNVTEVILILKRIAMIITAITSLKKKAIKREYKDCTCLVHIIKDMFSYIYNLKEANSTNADNQAFTSSINKLNTLYNDINILFDELKQQVVEDIDLIYDPDIHIEKNIIYLNDNNFEIKEKDKDCKIAINLFDACNCLYELNPNYINNIVKKFVNFFLEKYILIFSNHNNTFESIDRRLAWLKRALNNYKNMYTPIFPDYFNIQFYIVSKFCSITRKHIIKIISYSMEEINPASLIQTVIKIINFETFLIKNIFFVPPPDDLSLDNFNFIESPFPEMLHKVSSSTKCQPPTNIHNQVSGTYENVKRDEESITQKSPTQNSLTPNTAKKEVGIVEKERHNDVNKPSEMCDTQNEHAFKGIISCVFDSYLCSWLKYEENKILDKYENIINEENKEMNASSKREDDKIIIEQFEKKEFNNIKSFINQNEYDNRNSSDNFETILEGKNNIYKSAYKIFYLYKSYINMISQFSNCKTLFDFFTFFKSLLTKYSEELNSRVIEKISPQNKINNIFLISKIINTCYYVEQTMGEAYENLIHIISPLFIEKIDFKEQDKLFLNIKTKCIKIIISFMNDQIDKIIRTSIINIYNVIQLKKISPYIINLKNLLQKYFLFFNHIFNETHLIYLLEKTTALIIDIFFQTILSLTSITNVTAQQLLLDCCSIKKILYHIPNALTNLEDLKIDNEYELTQDENSCSPIDQVINFSEDDTEIDTSQSLVPKTYYNYVKKKINKIQFLIKLFISNTLDVNTFNLLLAQNNNICTIHEIEKILSLREDKHEHVETDTNDDTNKYITDIKKRGIHAAEEIKCFFSKITTI
ncbi:vacuolar protein sorting-associated protein 53, putative [Plasmodium chabaudi chabaudi]|uniref:Vacuolar protein sorting-associated protein 53, putative n=1 Tax=Plasmodium chabaudi chabaudi TaxID=31271 RepID=A0A1D3LAS0_PLACU|nr:vacuolar protein sorting-associated protein 53, putative [Plasmodium chabaudi chabaudi]